MGIPDRNRSRLAGLAAAVLSMSASASAVVTVVYTDGRPVPNVAVMCVRGASGTGLTDEQGRVALTASCLEVECMRGGLVTGRAQVVGGAATCSLAEPLVIRGEIRGTKGDARFSAQLVSSGTRVVVKSALAESSSSAEPPRFRIEAPAGSYELRIVRLHDYWSCSTRLVSLPAGEHDLAAEWREPAEVRGIVLDPDGRPFGRVLLRVVYDDPEPTLRTRCEIDRDALDVISERDGRFGALVDAEQTYRIVADDAWQPATVRLEESKY